MKTEYFCLEPQTFKLDGGAMFGIIPKPLWAKVHPSDQENRIDLALRLLLIKKENRIILIDTGIGDYHGPKFFERFKIEGSQNPLQNSLLAIGLLPSDITDLVISHLHFDHVGGAGQIIDQKMEPLFKNATLHLHRDHYQYSLSPTDRDTGSFLMEYISPIIEWYKQEQKLHLIAGMEGDLVAGLKFKCSMGHTPYLLHAYDQKYIYLADLIPTSNHVSIPWVMGYDISPGVSTVDKKNFLNFIHENKLTIIFEHDPKYYGCTILKNDREEYVCDQKFLRKEPTGYFISF